MTLQRPWARLHGFSLLELIVMMSCIAALVAVVVPMFAGAQDRSRNANVENNIHLVQQAMELYGADVQNNYPTALSTQMLGHGNNYLSRDTYPQTPWNKQQAAATDIPMDGALKGTVFDDLGMDEDPVSTASYGAIGYTNEAPEGATSQRYSLCAIGKKGAKPMLVLSVSNH